MFGIVDVNHKFEVTQIGRYFGKSLVKQPVVNPKMDGFILEFSLMRKGTCIFDATSDDDPLFVGGTGRLATKN